MPPGYRKCKTLSIVPEASRPIAIPSPNFFQLCFLNYKKSFFKTDFLIENLSSHNNIKNIIVEAIEKFP
jgi:hypothetical protein